MADYKERPILFSDPMVRAILSGQKTQTRRVVKPQPVPVGQLDDERDDQTFVERGILRKSARWGSLLVPCPYGQPGDRLWVREAWRIGAWCEDEGSLAFDYRASPELVRTPWVQIPDDHDGEKFNNYWIGVCDELSAKGVEPGENGRYRWEPGKAPLNWRPSIHMPRWACRIVLEIVSVRVERLHDISEADAIAEGAPWAACGSPQEGSHGAGFAQLWESINGPGSWEANPWVWVIEFKRVAA